MENYLNGTSDYLVQYVGFSTTLNDGEFVRRWAPFTTNYINAGIQTIDLYKVVVDDHLRFISRNVWDVTTYFRNFPSGIAGAGSGGGIRVTQLGGYWLEPEYLKSPDSMLVVFLNDETEKANSNQMARIRCSERVPYKQMLEASPSTKLTFGWQLNCEHLRRM